MELMSRRPGITFETATPSSSDTLPRMDVAAFVGFATRGPIDQPVPVEDVSRFRDIFGPPLDLVREEATGRMRTAHLHRSVEAFFRNGGRRCWVVRVANEKEASSPEPVQRTAFPVPGLISARTGRPQQVQARCHGATFDDLRVGTVLRRRVLPHPTTVEPTNEDRPSDGVTITWPARRADSAVMDGDLLRLSFGDDPLAYAPVASQTMEEGDDPGSEAASGPEGATLKVRTGPAFLFSRIPPALRSSLPDFAEQTEDHISFDVAIEAQSASGTGKAFTGTVFLETPTKTTGAEGARPSVRLGVELDQGDAPAMNLESQIVHVRGPEERLDGWFHLGRAGRGQNDHMEFAVREALWPVSFQALFGAGPLPKPTSVERQAFDLLGWKEKELQIRLDGLGFTTAHSRAWSDLPVDDDLFALEEGESTPPEAGTLWSDAYDPRFPFAGPDSSSLSGGEVFIPLGMGEHPDPARTRGRTPPPVQRSRLEKERLSTFSPSVFVDGTFDSTGSEGLATKSTESLHRRADEKILLREESSSGLHTLWPIREVTILAVPDAVHRGWTGPDWNTPRAASTPFLPAPNVYPDADPPVIRLSWEVEQLDEENVAVELQESAEPTFEEPDRRYRGSEFSIDRLVRDAPATLYFRYRVVRGRSPGAWSNTRRVDVPTPDFTPCRGRPGVPSVDLYELDRLRWDPVGSSGEDPVGYELQIDRTPTFDAPRQEIGCAEGSESLTCVDCENDEEGGEEGGDGTIFRRGPSPSGPPNKEYLWFSLPTDETTPPVRYARVRAFRCRGGQKQYGGWSRTVTVVRLVREETALVSKADYDREADVPGDGRKGLFQVQRAMLRFASARGDVLTVLALPEGDQPDDASRHVRRLRTPGAVLPRSEQQALSYGALYYPWLFGPTTEKTGPALMPPDGAASGLIADRARREGAWTAPANEPLAATRTVSPPLDAGQEVELEAQNVNVFGESPRGVRTLGASTLATDGDLEPITTRRLLILVGRLARREGPKHVFENNGARLRRRIADQFDDVLRRLYHRGAFAGATPSQGYRVVADESVNPLREVERGRIVVELRIAPTRPLKFLTVRLVERDDQPPTIESAPVTSA